MDGFLIKPLDREKLADALAGLAASRHRRLNGRFTCHRTAWRCNGGVTSLSNARDFWTSKTASIRGPVARESMQNGEFGAIDAALDPDAAAGECRDRGANGDDLVQAAADLIRHHQADPEFPEFPLPRSGGSARSRCGWRRKSAT